MAANEFPESDWKLLRKTSSAAYDRHCASSLQQIEALLSKQDLSPSEKFDEVSKLTRKRSKELYSIFETFNFSRSNAAMILLTLNNWGLITSDELDQFSPPVRAKIRGCSE